MDGNTPKAAPVEEKAVAAVDESKSEPASDPRMSMSGHSEMQVLPCFPGATALQIVQVEEDLYGHKFFGNKYTEQGCQSCKKK